MAVIHAGWNEPVAAIARRYAGLDGAAPFARPAMSPEQGAFLYGTAAHALDFDDVHLVSVTHPSAVIVPALLAIAGTTDRHGAISDAYAAGVSANILLGRMLGFAHYRLGWHATSTIGPLAAAVAGAHLLGFDEATTRHALALAAAQAGGLQRNFGTMAKPAQAGNAAAAGVRAVLLAAAGATGDPDIFAAGGYLDLYGAGGEQGEMDCADGACSLSLKLYPCCYAAHRPIGAALDARSGMGDADVALADRIELDVNFETMRPLRVRDPADGNEAKFCAAYAVATALHCGHVGLTDFTDAAIHRRAIRELMARITITDDERSGRNVAALDHGVVTVSLYAGNRLLSEGRCAAFPGSPDAPADDLLFGAKLADCAAVFTGQNGETTSPAQLRALAGTLLAGNQA